MRNRYLMPKEREDVEIKSSDSTEVYQQTKFMTWFEKAFPWLLVSGAALGLTVKVSGDLDTTGSKVKLGTIAKNIQVSRQLKSGRDIKI